MIPCGMETTRDHFMSDLFFVSYIFFPRASYTSSSFLGPYRYFFNVNCTLISSVELSGSFLIFDRFDHWLKSTTYSLAFLWTRPVLISNIQDCLIIRGKDCYPESRAQGVFRFLGVQLTEVTVHLQVFNLSRQVVCYFCSSPRWLFKLASSRKSSVHGLAHPSLIPATKRRQRVAGDGGTLARNPRRDCQQIRRCP
jgi:hypothetical protein